MAFDISAARAFVNSAELPDPSSVNSVVVSMDAEGPKTDVDGAFASIKSQAAVVGQDIVAFQVGTEKEFRAAISNASLLAQLLADREVPDKKDVYEWYAAYFGVLTKLGWVIQSSGWSTYEVDGSGVEVHKEIIKLATVILSSGSTALAMVTSTLDALKNMGNDEPWLKIFARESTHAETARFQVSVVGKGNASPDMHVNILAFSLQAEKTITQVLLFKVKKHQAIFRSNLADVTINLDAVRDLAPAIRERVRAYQRAYIAALPDL